MRLNGPSVTSCHTPAPSLFVSHRVTPPGEYTSQIEGPAVDRSGNLYVVNFHSAGTIGKVAPGASHSTLFATLHHGRIGSGIRFDRQGRMYIADFKKNNVLVIAPDQTDPQSIFTPTISISRTISPSHPTARFMRATRIFLRTPARSGRSHATLTARRMAR